MATHDERLAFALVLTMAASACNAVLGNDSATLADASADAAPDAAAPSSDDAAPTPIPDAAAPDADAAPPTHDAATSCEAGAKVCYGSCVAITDPLYGCMTNTCAVCDLPRATAQCAGGTCGIARCQPGYADCDGNPANGCETDLSQANHCGACNAVCPQTSPLCAPWAGSFACASGCGGQAPTLCGTQCVDTTSSVTHCGGCTTVCPAPAGSVASCAQSMCHFTCTTGLHACGQTCANDTSVATCGSSCTPCPTPPNSTPTCNGTSCGFACATGFGDCDSNATNGCEATLGSDPRNCGGCGRACPTGDTCVNANCVAPPPPDSGAPDTAPPDTGAPDTGPTDAGAETG